MRPQIWEERQGLLGETGDDIELENTQNVAPAFPSLPEQSLRSSWLARISSRFRSKGSIRGQYASTSSSHRWSWSQRTTVEFVKRSACLSWTLKALRISIIITFVLVLTCGIFFPSYSRPPSQYDVLRRRVEREPTQKGKANINNEQIFIAASLYDPGGRLVAGDWADSVQGLINILGPWNVHLSVYENDVDDMSKAAVAKFVARLLCSHSIVQEDFNISSLPHTTTWDGTRRLKRMQYLAHVRNRALQPLETSPTRFDKLLYLNDIVFDPIDAANLLFSTNADAEGKARYRAACAVDFENSVKFYDTFATRDLEGHDMGVIFYPWFTSAGNATSRNEVLAQKDAVPVKSCWGGMVAFEAKWFQESVVDGVQEVDGVQLPLRFRAENDTYWDASECCLIHADLAALSSQNDDESGIFMNPYIRVAYAKSVLDWLWLTRRVERLYSPIQSVVNWIGGRPTHNPRRLEEAGEEVVDKVWVWNDETQAALRNGSANSLPDGLQGKFKKVRRTALPGSFCGSRSLSYLVEDPNTPGKKWSHEMVPDGG